MSRLIKKLMASNPSLLKSKKYANRGPPIMVGAVIAPWTTRPTKIKKPAMIEPIKSGEVSWLILSVNRMNDKRRYYSGIHLQSKILMKSTCKGSAQDDKAAVALGGS